MPVIDARRREVFVLQNGESRVVAPADVELAAETVCVGNGAVRYRAVLERAGAVIPPDADERHLPRARFHAALATDFGPAEAVEPLYLRLPDADTTVKK
jgi:tRNA threonylcarbamoyladenosine biosynthesis protein TsaB